MISICIPTYEMSGKGVEFLKHSFDILTSQTFNEFEVVISDHSVNDGIERLCDKYSKLLDVNYINNVNDRGNSSSNINNAINNSKYDIVKVLFQDDFLYNQHSLQITIDEFLTYENDWLISRCVHSNDGITFYRDHVPYYHNDIYMGVNTISSPSVLTFLKKCDTMFDENLIWLMDCDIYKQLYVINGDPIIVNTPTVVNRTWFGQVQNGVSDNLMTTELIYVKSKWGEIE